MEGDDLKKFSQASSWLGWADGEKNPVLYGGEGHWGHARFPPFPFGSLHSPPFLDRPTFDPHLTLQDP